MQILFPARKKESVHDVFSCAHSAVKLPHGFFGRNKPFQGPHLFQEDKDLAQKVRAFFWDKKSVFLNQQHTAHVQKIVLENFFDSDAPCDGVVTKERGIVLCIKTADCAPVLLYDDINHVIGACHAGWRGACQGIIENTIAVMCDLGAQKEHILALIGPCIGWWNYEVKEDFREAIEKASSFDVDCFFKPWKENLYFDLISYCKKRLHGVKAIFETGHTTFSSVFYSHRASLVYDYVLKTQNISALMLPS